MQGLRAKDNVYKRRAFTDSFALLAGHAAAHTDNQVGVAVFKVFPAPKLVK